MDYQLEKSDPLDSRQFEIAVKSLADSLSYGTDASPFLGSGTDYVQSRLYPVSYTHLTLPTNREV